IGGNLVAIQASRISTYLHKNEKLGKVASYLRGRQAANPFWNRTSLPHGCWCRSSVQDMRSLP
ncbi:hypothetical protein D917_09402, partial [Trichinella nativa]